MGGNRGRWSSPTAYEIIQLKTKLAWYEEQFRLYQHKKFGSSSERFEDQGLLFNRHSPPSMTFS
ncbi:transposase [Endozoicomonas gorgoniicola]|uniref:transposase n=1 Tax=Endozoicomonas gorgoniicola TaxID=1234144 RepID=UPI0038991090